VCGSNGQTYSNECNLSNAACFSPGLYLKHTGTCPGPQVEAVLAEEEERECPERCSNIKELVCGSDGETYRNECSLEQAACREGGRGLEVAYTGRCTTVPVRSSRPPQAGCEVCQRIFRPVCASDGATYTNECEVRARACSHKIGLVVVKQGACADGDVVFQGEGSPDRNHLCGKNCPKVYRPVCATNGATNITFMNQCQLQEASCKTRQVLTRLGSGECQSLQDCSDSQGNCDPPLPAEMREDVPPGGLTPTQLTADVLEAALEGVEQLAGARGERHHLTLQYVESAQTQVVAGTNYLLTVLVGHSNCTIDTHFDNELCPVVNKDKSLRCDIVVHRRLFPSEKQLALTKQICAPAFDFRAVCIGCPEEGTPEAESARTVAQYVVQELTRTAAQAGVISRHLGLIGIKRFMKDNDGQGGFSYVVDVEVSETECSLQESFDPLTCRPQGKDMRLCTAEVHELDQPRKLGRGVELRRIEVTSTICKEPPLDLRTEATVTDRDVIQAAKAVTLEVGQSFGGSLWLVTRVVAATRRKVEDQVQYQLTLALAESDCDRELVEKSEENLYDGNCAVEPGAATKTCQVLVRRKLQGYRAVDARHSFNVEEQVCAERRVCPTSCPPLNEPTCGTDGVTYQSACHLQLASCAARQAAPLAVERPGHCSMQEALLRSTVLCSGCPKEGSRENTAVRAAAQAATISLSTRLNNTNYFALDSIIEASTQVVAGTNYLLTIVVGESDCPVGGDFSQEDCVINLDHENNLQCRVVVYKPLSSTELILSQQTCAPVPVAPHVRRDCNRKCKKTFSPVCGSQAGNPTTFLNSCLMEAAACISRSSIPLVVEKPCELEPVEVDALAARVMAQLRDSFPNPRRWVVNGLKAAQREEGGGTRLSIGIQESQCLKTARAREVCPAREGAKERRCQATLKGGKVRDVACEAAAITLCDGCDESEVGVAKLAVKKITGQWPSNQWALQHLAAAKKQEIGGKYVKHKLRLHMSETSCSREVVDIYSDSSCVLRQDAPDNYCEVTILESLHSNRKRVSRKTCAGYNVSQFF